MPYPCRHPAQPDDDGGGDFAVLDVIERGTCVEDKDTADLTNNLINPAIQTFEYDNNWFMNQNNYALMGAMAGFIFTNNREGYNQRVEWFTVNRAAKDQGFNGSIKQLFRLIDTNAATGEKLDKPVVQQVEMGRDQAHGAGDLTNAAIISRMLLAQGTKLDPVNGTVSTADNAVGPYEFLSDRILAAGDYFWQYMLGYDTPWVPVPYAISPDGTVRGLYYNLADSYRGRMNTAQFWDLYYYYTYVKGVNLAEKAPYFYEAFKKRIPSNYYYQGTLQQAWESPDGGADFWLYIPKEAEAEGASNLPKEQPNPALVELEDRYTAFDGNSSTKQEGSDSYVEFNATAQGSNRRSERVLCEPDRVTSHRLEVPHQRHRHGAIEQGNRLEAVLYVNAAGYEGPVEIYHLRHGDQQCILWPA